MLKFVNLVDLITFSVKIYVIKLKKSFELVIVDIIRIKKYVPNVMKIFFFLIMNVFL